MSWLLNYVLATGAALGGALQENPKPVLERTPIEWKAAEEGRWRDWDADVDPPEELKPFLIAGIQSYRQGHMPAALEAIYSLLEVAPEFPSALHQAGVIYFRLRRYGDAIVAFERYLSVAPHRLGDTRALAHCYYTLGEYGKAQAHYSKVLEINPESTEALRGFALSFMRLGDTEQALEHLRRVLELDPQHGNAATWIAQILFDEDKIEEALEAGERARDLDPYEPRPWFLLSQIYYVLGREEEGEAGKARFDELNRIAQDIRAAEARLLYDPTQESVYQRLIMLHRQSGDLRSVGSTLTRWLKVVPGRNETRVALLNLAEEMGDHERAKLLADGLRKVAGDDIGAWQALARYYAGHRDRVRQVEAEGELARLRSANRK